MLVKQESSMRTNTLLDIGILGKLYQSRIQLQIDFSSNRSSDTVAHIKQKILFQDIKEWHIEFRLFCGYCIFCECRSL